uniref:Uncharacterized protein n=1 Tax=Anguilla anguilla TaxID=7936 RepID=A0A0E9S6F6_ANGAN
MLGPSTAHPAGALSELVAHFVNCVLVRSAGLAVKLACSELIGRNHASK